MIRVITGDGNKDGDMSIVLEDNDFHSPTDTSTGKYCKTANISMQEILHDQPHTELSCTLSLQ